MWLLNIPLLVVIVLGLTIFAAYYSTYGIKVLGFTYTKEPAPLINFNRVFAPYYVLLTVCIPSFCAFITDHEIYKKYEDKFNWLSPLDVLKFPADQINIHNNQEEVQTIDFTVPVKDKKYYNLIFADWTGSTNNESKELLLKGLANDMKNAHVELNKCSLYDTSLHIKEILPLLFLSKYFSQGKVLRTHVGVFCDLGFGYTKQAFPNAWADMSACKFCENADGTTVVIKDYNSLINTCRQVDKRKGRTDFSFMATEIDSKLKQLDIPNFRPDVFVSIILISDFHHEVSPAGFLPKNFETVENEFRKLLANWQCIQQVTLIKIPVDTLDDEKSTSINRLMSFFQNLLKNRFTDSIDFTNSNFTNGQDVIKKILSASANYELVSPNNVDLSFYEPLKFRNSPADNMAKLKIKAGIGREGDTLIFKLRNTILSSINNLKIEIDPSEKEGNSEFLELNKSISVDVRRDDTFCFNMIFDKPEDLKNLYLDIYSSKMVLKKSIEVNLRPLLDKERCWGLIYLYVLTITSACIIITAFTWLHYKASIQYNLFDKRKSATIFFILAAVIDCAACFSFFYAYSSLFYRENAWYLIILITILVILLFTTYLMCRKLAEHFEGNTNQKA